MGVGRALILLAALVACEARPPAAVVPDAPIRVAVIGGMIETGFWQGLAERYRAAHGGKIEVVATGPKRQVIAAFRKGGVDLITVHACDAMINLVADGLARDPQPWARNDLVLVGPEADPAHVRGERDIVAALSRVLASPAPLLVHASLGADGVLHDLEDVGHFARGNRVLFDDDNQHRVLERAAALGAYTLIGRIPWLTGKLKAAGIALMVSGDPRMRRPYLVEVAASAPPAAHALTRLLQLQSAGLPLLAPATQAPATLLRRPLLAIAAHPSS